MHEQRRKNMRVPNRISGCRNLVIFLVALGWAGTTLAQQQGGTQAKSPPNDSQARQSAQRPETAVGQTGRITFGVGADPNAGLVGSITPDEPVTLDEALAAAMQRNPEIITAKAKLQLAEAELNNTRAEVAAKLVRAWGDRRTQTEIVELARETFARAEMRHKSGAPGGDFETYEIARKALIDAEMKQSQSEVDLRYLIGQAAPGGGLSGKLAMGGSGMSSAGQRAAPLQMPRGPNVEKLRQALLQPTEMDFAETPLADVVDYLKAKHGIEIQFDGEAYGDEPFAGAPDIAKQPITMSLKNMPLGAALQLWDDKTDHFKLVVRDYGILITTAERAEERGYFPLVEFARLSGGEGRTYERSENAEMRPVPEKPAAPAPKKAPPEKPKPPLKPVP
jgi:hypothetical protein